MRSPVRRHKLQRQYSDPLRILKKVGQDTYRLEDGSVWNCEKLISAHLGDSSQRDQEECLADKGHDDVSSEDTSLSSQGGVRRSTRIRKKPLRHEDFDVQYTTKSLELLSYCCRSMPRTGLRRCNTYTEQNNAHHKAYMAQAQ